MISHSVGEVLFYLSYHEFYTAGRDGRGLDAKAGWLFLNDSKIKSYFVISFPGNRMNSARSRIEGITTLGPYCG